MTQLTRRLRPAGMPPLAPPNFGVAAALSVGPLLILLGRVFATDFPLLIRLLGKTSPWHRQCSHENVDIFPLRKISDALSLLLVNPFDNNLKTRWIQLATVIEIVQLRLRQIANRDAWVMGFVGINDAPSVRIMLIDELLDLLSVCFQGRSPQG